LINDISVVIIAKDAQSTIVETLDSLKLFAEVILYLNNSSDNTESIASTYENIKIIKGEFIGFGPTKNEAATYSSNDWILSLDSDEVILTKLFNELKSLNLTNDKEVFYIKRDNYFLNKKVKYSGWGNDILLRLYNKSQHCFNGNMVHEFIETKDYTLKRKISNTFKHNAVEDINQFLQKVIKYSDIASQNKKTCSFIIVILKSFFAFFKTYILKLGILDGWRGLVISISNFNGKFFRYTKRYINCKNKGIK